jgi:hypothetical protein
MRWAGIGCASTLTDDYSIRSARLHNEKRSSVDTSATSTTSWLTCAATTSATSADQKVDGVIVDAAEVLLREHQITTLIFRKTSVLHPVIELTEFLINEVNHLIVRHIENRSAHQTFQFTPQPQITDLHHASTSFSVMMSRPRPRNNALSG